MKMSVLLLALVAAASPVLADPTVDYAVAAGHLVEVYQTEASPTEVWLQGAGGMELVAGGEPASVSFGCIELFRDNVYEYGCGLAMDETSSLVEARVAGSIETDVYDYDPDTFEFLYRGPGAIEADLVLSGEGLPRPAEPLNGVIVCGLPPDVPTGGGVLASTPLERTVAISGSLDSATLGSIELSLLTGRVTATTFSYAVACL